MNNCIKKLMTGGSLWFFPVLVFAQTNSISLDSCYVWAKQNYPLVRQYRLIAKSREYNLENASKGYLPQININGQATYQSDVTQLPNSIPGVPVLSKDQYKIYAEVNQSIYDGGMIKQQKRLQEAVAGIGKENTAVQLYHLRDRVNRLFFGILLIEEQLKQQELTKQDIRLGLKKIKGAIANGTALSSDADILKAALLKAGQHTTELEAGQKAYRRMLGLFIHRSLGEKTVFAKPPKIIPSQEIRRPELNVFGYKDEQLDAQEGLLDAGNRPKLGFFGQAGYGRPAFNILSNSFDPFYIAGLRLSIPLSGFYTLKNKKALINIRRESLAVQKETFLFNTSFTLQQQDAEIIKLQKILKTDAEIIPLRTNIKNTALAQLENGVINTSDYLREVHAEDEARQQQVLHEIQLLQAEYNEQTTTGN